VTQAHHVLSSGETDWSSEQLREIESLVNDIELLRDLVCATDRHCLLSACHTVVTFTNVIDI